MAGFFPRVASVSRGEAATALLMFVYSFLAMTGYNVLRPITRSKFIASLGADNLPYVLLAAGLLIGVLMQGYSRAAMLVPRRVVIPIAQLAVSAILVVFWLLFASGAAWVSVAFYVFGLMLGILLISQFWTLANDIYDPRQAKRVFGFIGGGASLGGASGAAITALMVERVGTDNLLLVSAAVIAACAAIVWAIVRRQPLSDQPASAYDEHAVGGGEAIHLLTRSRHLQLIATVIGFAAIGAAIIDQQLNMAAETMRGGEGTDAMTGFLAQVSLYLSLAGFVVQVALTSQIHRSLGLGFALLMLPVGLAGTAVIILVTGALWAPAVARVLDTSLRYTIDKTTREVLFLPLPADLKYRAKPFVDVTVDRFAKAIGALLILVLIKPWGLSLSWPSLSYASLLMSGLWMVVALRARAEYLRAFRRGIEAHALAPAVVQADVADPATIELLVEELSSPDDLSVLYAVDMLTSLDRRQLITPLLLRHDSPAVRARALRAIDPVRRSTPGWPATVERLLRDDNADVRAAAIQALAALRREDTPSSMQRYLDDPEPRVAATAAVVLADTGGPAEVEAAASTLTALAGDTREEAAAARREVAAALGHVKDPRCRLLLIGLIADEDVTVAREAIRSVKQFEPIDPVFVPGLVALLGHRGLKAVARDALVSSGDAVVPPLHHFLDDRDEDPWVRRHIPATLARIPVQASMDALAGALAEPDGFLRFKVLTAMERLRRDGSPLACPPAPLEDLVAAETARYANYLTLGHNLLTHEPAASSSLLKRALDDKIERTIDRLYRVLGLMHSVRDVAAARYAIEHGDRRARAGALEFLDNVLPRQVRRRVLPVLEDLPIQEKVRRAYELLQTRPRDLEDTLVQLVHDEDPVVSATAIHFVERREFWSLAPDLEWTLEHRRVSDWHVFEAASWALAARRMADRRWDLWLEPVPTVELVDRLRAIPIFDFVMVDELFRIAAAARQVRHEPGRDVYHEGEHPDSVQFLVDGSVRFRSGESEVREVSRPAALGFEEVLEGCPLGHSVRAADRAVCLSIPRDHFLTVLSDSVEVAQGMFRLLLGRPQARRWRIVYTPTTVDDRAPAVQPLQAADKMRLLRRMPLFSRALVTQLLDVVAVARETPLRRGLVLLEANDEPAILHVIAGELLLEGEGAEPIIAGPGSTVGMSETLAGEPLHRRVTARGEGVVLRLDRGVFYDVAADHVGLLQGLFSALLRTDEDVPALTTARQPT
jgi:ATP/ADP translocase/HEAT repeat protein/CRP-like cAMP-binding protein